MRFAKNISRHLDEVSAVLGQKARFCRRRPVDAGLTQTSPHTPTRGEDRIRTWGFGDTSLTVADPSTPSLPC